MFLFHYFFLVSEEKKKSHHFFLSLKSPIILILIVLVLIHLRFVYVGSSLCDRWTILIFILADQLHIRSTLGPNMSKNDFIIQTNYPLKKKSQTNYLKFRPNMIRKKNIRPNTFDIFDFFFLYFISDWVWIFTQIKIR